MLLLDNARTIRRSFFLVLALAGTACAPYQIRGNVANAPPLVDKGISSKVNEVIGARRIALLLSSSIKDAERKVPPTKYTQAVPSEFYINRAIALRLTVSEMNSEFHCTDGMRAQCGRKLILHVSQLLIRAATYSESGFKGADMFARTVGYVDGDKHEDKVCLTEGIGPSRFWYSASTLNASFQYAAHEALVKAVICLISPNSVYNKPEIGQYVFGVDPTRTGGGL